MTANAFPPPKMGEPYLLTPGPLTTAYEVKQAMLKDWGSWDDDFRAMTRDMRRRLLALLGEGSEHYDCVPMQGSGSFCVEAMLGSFVPRDGKVLVLANGAYGLRAATTMDYLGRAKVLLDKGDYLPPRGDEVARILAEDPAITHVLAIHCETSSGILNPIEEISEATYAAGRKLLIDSMSAFGAVPLEPSKIRFEAFVSSANKCIEGVPGFGFVIAKKALLESSKGLSHSLALDVHAQWANMEKTGQWRYTPPTHVVAAFIEALKIFSHLANVGDCRSLVIHPASTTHFRMSDEALAQAGIGAGTIRLSVGLEDADDLIDDLKRALKAAERAADKPANSAQGAA